MKSETKPFEALLGNTVELRLMEFLLATPRLDFNITELAGRAGVSRQSADGVIKKFTRWKVARPASHRGNMTFYAINLDSPIVQAFYAFNEALIGDLNRRVSTRRPSKRSRKISAKPGLPLVQNRGTSFEPEELPTI